MLFFYKHDQFITERNSAPGQSRALANQVPGTSERRVLLGWAVGKPEKTLEISGNFLHLDIHELTNF